MGINNKYEMLAAMSDIDEKYIKEANWLIENHLAEEREVVRLEPMPRKPLWKSFAAAAACAAVLVVGTVTMFKLVQSGVLPFQNTSSDNQAYLDEVKERMGASVDVVYAHDRLKFTEAELPAERDGFTLDYGNSFVLDSNRILVELRREGKRTGAGVYYIGENVLETLYIENPKYEDSNNMAYPVYADSKYMIVLSTYEPEPESYGARGDVDKLYIFDSQSLQCVTIYNADGSTASIRKGTSFAMLDGKLYFDVVYGNAYSTSATVYCLDIETGEATTLLNRGGSPKVYKNDIVYKTPLTYRAMNGAELPKFSSDPDWEYEVVFGEDSVYEFKHSPYDLPFGYEGEETFTNITTGEQILSYDAALRWSRDGGGYISFFVRFRGSDEPERFIYSMDKNELLVFGEDEAMAAPTWCATGFGLSLGESAGNTIKVYIVSDKSTDIAIKYAPPKIPDNAALINGNKSFISFVPVVSAKDVFDIRTMEDDDIFFGITPNAQAVGDENVFAVVNGHKAKLGDYINIGHIVRVVALYENVPDPGSTQTLEIGLYDPETREYTTVMKREEGGDVSFCGHSENYLFFKVAGSSAFAAVDISSGDITNLKTIKVGEGLSVSGIYSNIIEGDGLFFFNAVENGTEWMYSFDPVTGELKKLLENAEPYYYGGLFYSLTDWDYLKSLDGEYSFSWRGELGMISPYGIFGEKTITIGGMKYDVIFNKVTGEIIFGAAAAPTEGPYGSIYGLNNYTCNDYLMEFVCYDIAWNSVRVLFDMRSNRLIVYDDELSNCSWTNLPVWYGRNEDGESRTVITLK